VNLKEYLPYAQFAAAVVAIGVGGHRAIDLFLPKPLPITFDSVLVSDAVVGNTALVETAFWRNRECPFTDWSPIVIDSAGVRWPVQTTVGESITQGTDSLLRDKYLIQLPSAMNSGPAIYEGTITYVCDGKLTLVYYPAGLDFCVLPRSAVRPEACEVDQ